MDGEWHEFDEIGIASRIRVRARQGLALFQKTLSEIFHSARDHQPGVR